MFVGIGLISCEHNCEKSAKDFAKEDSLEMFDRPKSMRDKTSGYEESEIDQPIRIRPNSNEEDEYIWQNITLISDQEKQGYKNLSWIGLGIILIFFLVGFIGWKKTNKDVI